MTTMENDVPVLPVAESVSSPSKGEKADRPGRDTVESIVVAIILAFLFRGVVAEAFVIPTGSMAPTLQGRHMDVACPECGYQYRTGASIENSELGGPRGEVVRTRCPICRFSRELDKDHDPNQRSFNGDRILVSKFAYLVSEPKRWDVIVFKYPGDAKTPYIKRLVGLPGETIQIRHGDVHTQVTGSSAGEPRFQIARKPPAQVVNMLQLVDDTAHVGERLRQAQWPSRWQPAPGGRPSQRWQPISDPAAGVSPGQGFEVEAGSAISWLRYRHLIPRAVDWERIERGETSQLNGYQGQLITDYYAYNDSNPYAETTDWGGQCWVGDLAVEVDLRSTSGDGELLLDLVEGGSHYRCTVRLATGEAVLEIDGGRRGFAQGVGSGAAYANQRFGLTGVQPGQACRLRFANVDDELLLWVNDQVVKFDGPTTFESPREVVPRWSAHDPGDLAPVGVGARQARIEVERLKVLRDVYYRAVGPVEPYKDSEYDRALIGYGFDVNAVMANPASWSSTRLFAARRSVTFELAEDQFFPLGDNSPESRDARLWSEVSAEPGQMYPPPYVDRDLLIGRAVFIYWPHAWRWHTDWLPLIPNVGRMGRIL
ncbi:MAG: signal peptidase I [Pirellulaceae bacterium]